MVAPLIACFDVHYAGHKAVAAGVWFRGWNATAAECESVVPVPEVAEYEPGAFYRRELPCILAVSKSGPRADITIVDGYVWLADGKPGLGSHLHGAIGGIVVGVAKTRFAGATSAVEVFRGRSRSPLFVTAAGVSPESAANWVAGMAGSHRMPTLLRRVDTISRAYAAGKHGIQR